ncbi:MAG TPA: SusC/RagA family TonB-linked outer membrane protein, partial [Chitinophagaceae bacterium]
GLQEMIIGTGATARMLKVGHAIDQFWLLQNQGIYNRDKEIPVNPQTHQKETYKGTTLMAGDPIWKDQNGDYTIDDKDKVMMGHYLPQVSGGFSNDFLWRNFTFSFSLYYALGRKILNQNMANHLDFVNHEGQISMDAIKEITFWTKAGDYTRYPMYNPWSNVIPYRADQDLFLEDGSFLKLRAISLQYDLTKAKWWNKKSAIHGFSVYVTANNLFTITPYSGRDPEVVYYNGVDDGYGLPISKSYTVGVKMDL